MKRRVIVIVCDSLGVGELPDAAEFGDAGSNTLGHVLRDQSPRLPTLESIGLLHTLPQPASRETPRAAFGRMAERSAGKDTTTGHWEMMGLVVETPFRTYPDGFPREVITEYERRIGRKTLGNKPASGTVILDELGEEHMRSGSPIVYTSGDSVFQVAAHEEVIPVEELWRICAVARELMRGEHNVGRIIARPSSARTKVRSSGPRTGRTSRSVPQGRPSASGWKKRGSRWSGSGKSPTSSTASESRPRSAPSRTPTGCARRSTWSGNPKPISSSRTWWTSTRSTAIETIRPATPGRW
jgi:phosphopentomutase